jgi:hypothetical protein
MTVQKTWWLCYHCNRYHTTDGCPSWFGGQRSTVDVSPRVQYYVEDWKIELWSTGVSRITARRERSE